MGTSLLSTRATTRVSDVHMTICSSPVNMAKSQDVAASFKPSEAAQPVLPTALWAGRLTGLRPTVKTTCIHTQQMCPAASKDVAMLSSTACPTLLRNVNSSGPAARAEGPSSCTSSTGNFLSRKLLLTCGCTVTVAHKSADMALPCC